MKMGLNVKTVAKWRRRKSVDDEPMGPKSRRNVLPLWEETLVAAVRQLTWASLEVLLPRLQAVLPHLNRSAAYRVWEKWGVSRKPRTAPGPKFPFARRSVAAPSGGEPFQLRVFRLQAAKEGEVEAVGQLIEGQMLIFMIGENSGRIFAQGRTNFNENVSTVFLNTFLKQFKEQGKTPPVGSITAPAHWTFYDATLPDPDSHRFWRLCIQNNIDLTIDAEEPMPTSVLEKGWPGFEAPRKPRRRKKPAPVEELDEEAPDDPSVLKPYFS
jgi:hypothetical protein